jgi:hypothetical protein
MSYHDSKPRVGQINASNAVAATSITVAGNMYVGASPPDHPQQLQLNPPRKLPPLCDELVPRNEAVKGIHQLLRRPRNPGVTREIVIYGQGGIGKTSLAVAYAWRHVDEYPGGIFLLDCSLDDFPSALSTISPYIFPDYKFEYRDISIDAFRVKTFLETSGKPTLLILDNIHDVEQWKRIHGSGLLPTGACDRLITTTDPELPTSLPFSLERLSVEEGIDLLAGYRNDIRLEANGRTAQLIVEWLGGVPLYLTIVGVYMRRTPGLAWEDYANSLQLTGMGAIRGAENAAKALPDGYNRRVDQVLDSLLSSLSESERRSLEYAALMFQGEIPEYALLILLAYDRTITVQPPPGYEAQPVRHIIDELEKGRLLLPQGGSVTRTFAIHEILRWKIIERIGNDLSYKAQFFRNTYDAVVGRFLSFDKVTTAEDPGQAMSQLLQFFNQMQVLFVSLERCGYLDNADAHYYYWSQFYRRLHNARELTRKTGGRIDMRMVFLSENEGHTFPIVVIEEPDQTKAMELAKEYGGRVKLIIGDNGTAHGYMVTINLTDDIYISNYM